MAPPVGLNRRPACTQNPRPVPALGSQDLIDAHQLFQLQRAAGRAYAPGVRESGLPVLLYLVALHRQRIHVWRSRFQQRDLLHHQPLRLECGQRELQLRYSPQHLSANAVYMFPFKGNRWKEGWQLSGITSWHTGFRSRWAKATRWTRGTSSTTSARTTYAPGCNVYANQTAIELVQRSLLCALAVWDGRQSGKERAGRGPGYAETDISVTKITRINETDDPPAQGRDL